MTNLERVARETAERIWTWRLRDTHTKAELEPIILAVLRQFDSLGHHGGEARHSDERSMSENNPNGPSTEHAERHAERLAEGIIAVLGSVYDRQGNHAHPGEKVSALVTKMILDVLHQFKPPPTHNTERERLARLPLLNALKSFVEFVEFQPEMMPDWPRRAAYGRQGYEKGDESAPFYSEAYLYNLLGKEDARTLLAIYDKAIAALEREQPVEIDTQDDMSK